MWESSARRKFAPFWGTSFPRRSSAFLLTTGQTKKHTGYATGLGILVASVASTLSCYCHLIFRAVQLIIHNPTDNHSAAMSQPPAFNLTPLDLQLLAMKDEDFVAHSWDDLRDIIGES